MLKENNIYNDIDYNLQVIDTFPPFFIHHPFYPINVIILFVIVFHGSSLFCTSDFLH